MLAIFDATAPRDPWSPDRKADHMLPVKASVVSLGVGIEGYLLTIAEFRDWPYRFGVGGLRFLKSALREPHRGRNPRVSPKWRPGLSNNSPIAFSQQG